MGVNLCGRDVTMTEHLLHGAQVGAAFEQMRREAMAQRMRAYPCESWIVGGPSLEGLEKSLAGHRAPEPRDEYGGDAARNFLLAALGVVRRIENFLAPIEVSSQRANRRAAHRHHPLFAALAEHDDNAGRQIHLMQLQTDQL